MLGNRPSFRRFVPLLAVGLLAACGDDENPSGTPDTGADTTSDVSEDPSADAAGDILTDTPDDVTPDASTDADVGHDVSVETGADADVSDDTDADTSGDVADDADTSEPGFAVSGTIDGPLRPVWLTLTSGEVEETVASYDGAFAFETELPDGAAYDVTVTGHPEGRFCMPETSSGTIDGAAVELSVDCSAIGARWTTLGYIYDAGVFTQSELTVVDGGMEIRSLRSSDAGPDGEPLTGDDSSVVAYYYLYADDGTYLRGRVANAPGPDGEWFTDDDVLERGYLAVFHPEDGRLVGRYSTIAAGDDGVWFTEDDLFDQNSEYIEYLDVSAGVECTVYRHVGPDGQQGTEDDTVREAVLTTTTEIAARAMTGTYSQAITDPGTDGVYCTGDDVVSESRNYDAATEDGAELLAGTPGDTYNIRYFDADGRRTRDVVWEMTGSDIGGPDVDMVESYWAYTWEPVREDRHSVRYEGPGPDGDWFTDDDLAARAGTVRRWDLLDRPTLEAEYDNGDTDRRGPDLMFGTSDDRARSWETWDYADDGSYCHVRRESPGADELWDDVGCGEGVVDDTIAWVRRYTADDAGRIVQWGLYVHPADDGEWGTEDDALDCSDAECGWRTPVDGDRYLERTTTDDGDDDTWFTDDDAIDRARLRAGEPGRVHFDARFDGPGDDGVYGTGDDVVESYWTYGLDDSGRYVGDSIGYQGPGDDGVWFNEDDWVRVHERYIWVPFHPALD